MNTFGQSFRVTTFGESHGVAVGAVIDGCPPGLALSGEDIAAQLRRRRPGQSDLVTPRKESDEPVILSGVFEGQTTGTPIAVVVWNKQQRSSDYDPLKDLYRPGHADYTYDKKYGIRDWRGSGRASGRETVGRVIGGAVARKLLAGAGVHIEGATVAVGEVNAEKWISGEIENNPVRSPDPDAVEGMTEVIERARDGKDSVGGLVEVRADGVPAGWGDPVFGKLDGRLGAALLSIGAVKGVEIGGGFAVSTMRGSASNDPITPSGFARNSAGGMIGGITTGAQVVARIAVKPTSSIEKKQKTVDRNGRVCDICVKGRHDPCICPRIVPVAEAMTALVLADAMLLQRALRGGA